MSRVIPSQGGQPSGEEHVAIAVHGVRVGEPRPSDSAAVVGDGPLALATIDVLLARGVGKVACLTRSEDVKVLAERAGTVVVFVSDSAQGLEQARARFGGFGPDFVFECEGGSEARSLAIDLVRPAGTVVLMADEAMPTRMNPNLLVFGDKRVLGSRRFDDRDLEMARNLMATRRLRIVSLES